MTIDREKLKALAKIEILVHHEDADPLDSFGYDTKEENEVAARQVRELADRTEWGWCVVEVRATFAGVVGRDVLGGCSYESEADFKSPGGYYDDMVSTALDDLATQLEDIADNINEVLK